jgi:hypothetical protein
MIEGTPARLAIFSSINAVSRFFGAYSSKYTAAPIPRGTANVATIPISQRLPIRAGNIPARSALREGPAVKNELSILGNPSRIS